MSKPKVLMVCLGNICRSPLAEALLRKIAAKEGIDIEVASAGTSNHHVGEKPDKRMQETALQHKVSMDGIVSRQITKSDLDYFDQIYAMDKNNYRNLIAMADNDIQRSKIKLILETVPNLNQKEVPDPYFGGNHGFDDVYNLLEQACKVIVEELKTKA
jgi:protein-tyrosine phosphatase